MIKSYNPNTQGTHVIRVTFMQWEYVGHISYEIYGNCHGMHLFESFIDDTNCEEIERLPENDCQLSYCEDYDYFSLVLKNKDGDTLQCEFDASELKSAVVRIEIAKVLEGN